MEFLLARLDVWSAKTYSSIMNTYGVFKTDVRNLSALLGRWVNRLPPLRNK